MYTHIGKYDQRIAPSSDTIYITQSAVNRSVDKENKDNPTFKKKKKKNDGFQDHDQDTVLISDDGHAVPADIFDEHDEAWISISALYANAKARLDVVADVLMKRQVIEDGMSQEDLDLPASESDTAPDIVLADPKIAKAIKAYETQDHFGEPKTSHDITAERKKTMQEEIEQESDEDLAKEHEHLQRLIPCLEKLIQADYTHIPLLPNQTFLQTVETAAQKLS